MDLAVLKGKVAFEPVNVRLLPARYDSPPSFYIDAPSQTYGWQGATIICPDTLELLAHHKPEMLIPVLLTLCESHQLISRASISADSWLIEGISRDRGRQTEKEHNA